MPFTLSHPAAALPLRKHLLLSAMVVGSMSPDFEYFWRLAGVSRFSHTLPAVFYFCLPVSLLALWLFHSLIKRPGLELLPYFRKRIETQSLEFPFWPASRFFLIIISIVVGALTHVWWDSLTHEHGYMVERWPFLQRDLVLYARHELKVFKLLQYGSSVMGLLLLSASLLNWLRHAPVVKAQRGGALPKSVASVIAGCIIVFTIMSGVGLGLWSAVEKSGSFSIQVFVVQTAIGGMLGLAMSMLIYSVIMHAALPRITTH
ncbi:MAG TPA: DUF4184 family protein [Pyrinomonadaceae bacterium]|jgi:hypothetical protein